MDIYNATKRMLGRDGREDAIVARYWHAADYHGGQSSKLYERLSRLSRIYRPGPMERGPEPESAAAMLYEALATRSY